MRDEETQKLVQAVRRGEDDARGLLLERIRPRLVVWCSSSLPASLRPLYDSEDLAQEILLAVDGAVAEFRGSDARSFNAWIFRIAENKIRDVLDYAGAEKRRLPQPASFSQTSPSARAMRAESVERLLAAIERLPEDYRRVIRLRRIEEREPADVAAAMGRSDAAVRVLYLRAVRALRERLGDDA